MKELSISNEYMNLVLKKECISSESHNRKLSAFWTGFYGNRDSLIISKISQI